MTALLPAICAQAAIFPLSPEKMNRDGAVFEPTEIMQSLSLPLHTIPVGSPPALATTSGVTVGCAFPVPWYNVEVSLWLLATHTGADGPNAMPHPFTRLASVWSAPVPASETS